MLKNVLTDESQIRPRGGCRVLDALSYYEQQQPKLGRRFKEEIEQTLHWLAENSEVCRLRSNGYRRLNLRIFPYYIP